MAQNVFFGTLLGQLVIVDDRNFDQSGRLPIFQYYKHLSNCPYAGQTAPEVPDFYKGMC